VGECPSKPFEIKLSRYCNGAELLKVTGQELRVEQGEPARFQPRNEVDERDLARIALARKHAFTEERRPEADTIQPAHKATIAPAFHAMRAAHAVKPRIE
jgi:hypothetical protein